MSSEEDAAIASRLSLTRASLTRPGLMRPSLMPEETRPPFRLSRAPSRADGAAGARPKSAIPLFERIATVIILVIAQSAFTELPLQLRAADVSELRPTGEELNATNPLNAAAMAFMTLSTLGFCLYHRRMILRGLLSNWAFVLISTFVLSSVLWSIDPAMTIRRAFIEIIYTLFAIYFAERYSKDELIKLITLSLVISAVGSLVALVAIHGAAVMPEDSEGIGGSWRGVFPHKNVLGDAMGTGLIWTFYLWYRGLLKTNWCIALWGLFVLLVAGSGAGTAKVDAVVDIMGFILFLCWTRGFAGRITVVGGLAAFALVAIVIVIYAPTLPLEILGKDRTLTGRTSVWADAYKAATEHPLLGWGYKAFWQDSNPSAHYIWDREQWIVPHSHNALLEVAIDGGVVGVTILVIMLLWSVRTAMLCMFGGSELLGWIALQCFFYTLITGASEPVFYEPQRFFWTVFMIMHATCAREWRNLQAARPLRFEPRNDSRSILLRAKPLESMAR